MALNSVSTANEETVLDNQILLKKSRQCAGLTRVVRSQLGGATISREERELFGLMSDLAKLIYEELVNRPAASEAENDAFEVAGKLTATVESIIEVDQRVPAVSDDEERNVLVTRIGWLQNAADDLAGELVGLIEVSCAKEQSGPMPG